MAWIRSAAAIMLICFAASGAFGQTEPPPEGDTAPIVPPGPIVNGKHVQPTQMDIEQREAVRQPGEPGQTEATPPQRGTTPADKELDELYEEVLRQSKQR